jgi:quercetin dioxygenase-like cupin family protein
MQADEMNNAAPRDAALEGSPASVNGVPAAIDAEVNEGGPPSPVPCDTPTDSPAGPHARSHPLETPSMLQACPAPDRVIRLPLGGGLRAAASATLVKTAGIELIRLVIPAGKEIPPHRVPVELTVQCIEGHVSFRHAGAAIELHPGEMMHLCPNEIHSLKGMSDSSVLVTRLRLHADDLPETFPAS